jgi:hypothetical protein
MEFIFGAAVSDEIHVKILLQRGLTKAMLTRFDTRCTVSK